MKARWNYLIAAAFAALVLSLGSAAAQERFAVKTNLLHDATASIDLGVEYGFAPKWSAELSGSYNGWQLGDMQLKHLLVAPEVRYWFCRRFAGTFVSLHAFGGKATLGGFWNFEQYYRKFPNLKSFLLKDAFTCGGGIGIGHAFILGRHWNLETEIGVGYMYTKGDEYEMIKGENGKYYLPENTIPVLEGSIFDYLGPTKLAVSIVYLF